MWVEFQANRCVWEDFLEYLWIKRDKQVIFLRMLNDALDQSFLTDDFEKPHPTKLITKEKGNVGILLLSFSGFYFFYSV